MTERRTIVAAMGPTRLRDGVCVFLKVWFEELAEPVDFVATPDDCEAHGRELWIRALAGEYGPVTVVDRMGTL